MLGKKKPKTKTVSSVVPEDVEKWLKSGARREGVTPSMWIQDILFYSMITDAMTKGELSNVVHDFVHLSDAAGTGKQIDLNVWRRHVEATKGYLVSRVRRGLEMYQRGNNVPDAINAGVVTLLANTSDGRDRFRNVYDPLSDIQVMEALRELEQRGEVKIEGDTVRIVRLGEGES